MSQGVGDFMVPLATLLLARCLYFGALLGLLSCMSGSWRRCTCTNVLLVCEGEVGELVQPGGMWGLPCRASGRIRKDLCMVPCHSFHIYGIWTGRSKRVWGMVKSHQLGVVMQVRALLIGKTGSHYYNTALLWNFIASLAGCIYCKTFYWIPLFTILLFYVFEGLAKPKVQLKVS